MQETLVWSLNWEDPLDIVGSVGSIILLPITKPKLLCRRTLLKFYFILFFLNNPSENILMHSPLCTGKCLYDKSHSVCIAGYGGICIIAFTTRNCFPTCLYQFTLPLLFTYLPTHNFRIFIFLYIGGCEISYEFYFHFLDLPPSPPFFQSSPHMWPWKQRLLLN